MTRKKWSSIWIFVDTKLINSEMVPNYPTCKGWEILMFSLRAILRTSCFPNYIPPSSPYFFCRIFAYSSSVPTWWTNTLSFFIEGCDFQVKVEFPYGQQSPCLRLNLGTVQFFCNLCHSLVDTLSNRKLFST